MSTFKFCVGFYLGVHFIQFLMKIAWMKNTLESNAFDSEQLSNCWCLEAVKWFVLLPIVRDDLHVTKRCSNQLLLIWWFKVSVQHTIFNGSALCHLNEWYHCRELGNITSCKPPSISGGSQSLQKLEIDKLHKAKMMIRDWKGIVFIVDHIILKTVDMIAMWGNRGLQLFWI